MLAYFVEHCILHQTSCVYTPQQNGIAERKHQYVLNVAHVSGLPDQFWGECVAHAVYLINQSPPPLLDNLTLYDVLFHKPSSYAYLHIFSSLCHVGTPTTHQKSLIPGL